MQALACLKVKVSKRVQEDLVKDGGQLYFINYLNLQEPKPPQARRWSCSRV